MKLKVNCCGHYKGCEICQYREHWKAIEVNNKLYVGFYFVLLPSDTPTNIIIEDEGYKWQSLKFHPTKIEIGSWVSYRHLYVISNEQLKQGDWFLWTSARTGEQEIHRYHSDAGYGIKTYTEYNEENGSSLIVNHSGCNGKIVTTNNPELSLDVATFETEVWVKQVPQIIPEALNLFIQGYNNSTISEKVMLEVEENCIKGCDKFILNGEKSICCGDKEASIKVTENNTVNFLFNYTLDDKLLDEIIKLNMPERYDICAKTLLHMNLNIEELNVIANILAEAQKRTCLSKPL